MANLIILKLTPAKPISGADFRRYLNNLDITAFDLSFGNPKEGVPIGHASGAWTPPSDPSDPDLHDFRPATPKIFQHYSLTISPVGLKQTIVLEAVATAVIEVATAPPLPSATEYGGMDLRLEIKNNGRSLLDERVDFNVAITASPASFDPSDYIKLEGSIFFTLPDPDLGLDPTVAFVNLPADGSVPSFNSVIKAIDLVLAQDPKSSASAAPANIHTLSPLTAAQALQVAREITWNRLLHPSPIPPRPLEEMYTRPHPPLVPGSDNEKKADMDRKQFEAELMGFYAIQSANSDRLAQYVFAASAAVWAEAQTGPAVGKVGFNFPVDPVSAGPGSRVRDANVILLSAPGFALDFHVPAAYFYALGAAFAPSVIPGQRFHLATGEDEQQIVAQLRQAIDAGVIDAPAISPENAARRLAALGAGRLAAEPQCSLNADVQALVNAWLAFMGADIGAFWATLPVSFLKGHLDLVLSVVTRQLTETPASKQLISDIKSIPVANVEPDLKALTTADWIDFFIPARVTLLPPFTAPGSAEERVAAFVRQLRKFFDVATQKGLPVAAPTTAIPKLGIASDDPIRSFEKFYNAKPTPPFKFGSAVNQPYFDQAVKDVFPDNSQAQAWLDQILHSIDALFRVTTGVGPPALQFSLMEALYARGFNSKASIPALSASEFEHALTGTVAYEYANLIYVAAGGADGPRKKEPGEFQPVNPDGSLVNCIPPWHLSPLGPVGYLHELLKVSPQSTCENPMPTSGDSLGGLIAKRRGAIGSLQVTATNVHTPIPLIDLVNENLEALASGSVPGVVYNTHSTQLAGHDLSPAGPEAPKESHPSPFLHDPATLFAAIPEHSSPATPVKQPTGYVLLQSDFSAPTLPYSQPLDISRSYLYQLGSSRFQAMRTFRENITEFVLNPLLEPTDFQRNLWRYPVRIEIAREYLGISPDEYDLLYTKDTVTTQTTGRLLLRALYGFNAESVKGKGWTALVLEVPEFLQRTGLSYCEFIELWESKFVEFKRGGEDGSFPSCEPCCGERFVIQFVNPQDPFQALAQLAVFIRLWRSLQHVRGAQYTFAQLSDICQVLQLFLGSSINPDFIRQLAAFQMLRDDFHLSLGNNPGTSAVGADRTRLLGLWTGTTSASGDWAIDHLLERIEDYAEERYTHECGGERHRGPEFMKIIRENIDTLSGLAGFNPATADKWDSRPVSTLRFAEIVAKLYMSEFTTGEIFFLFTAGLHLQGDDPFPQQDANEALDFPFDLPEEDHPFRLWTLRHKLLCVEVSDEEAYRWDWHRITQSFLEEFDYEPTKSGNALQSLGEHFFPETLSAQGISLGPTRRQYRASLSVTNAGRWNVLHTRFGYDSGAKELYAELPILDETVVKILAHLDQLTLAEQQALQELYFKPRADLAPFALIFDNFTEAEHHLIEERDEQRRWQYFQRAFALFRARCHIIAQHLAEHVSSVTDGECVDWELAWLLLRRLLADENLASAPWEKESGEPPVSNLWQLPGGGAFAALLGLTGTGLWGGFTIQGAARWAEVRGPMSAFGQSRNESNAPFPTVLPSMGFTLPLPQLRFATVDNGFARRASDGEHLGGAEGFEAVWTGVLLVEQDGSYQFYAGSPTPYGEVPDFEACEKNRWRVTVGRGQKTWLLLNHHWGGEEAPDSCSEPLHMRRGAYFFKVEFAQESSEFDEPGDACKRDTGFEIKHKGPDTCEKLEAISIRRLYRDIKSETLKASLDKTLPQAAQQYLALHYTSSVRDIRRTYQRAFKALLFSHRLSLSAKLTLRQSQSELGYMLDHGKEFLGTSYFPGEPGTLYLSHRAYFDFNFLPVADLYKPPTVAVDDRSSPSLKRRQALFDWFERLYDYAVMRRHAGQHYHHRLVWLMFHEAENHQRADTAELLLHLAIDLQHAKLLLKFYQGKTLDWSALVDERWAVRVWRGDLWIRRLLAHFVPKDISAAQPELWASDDAASMTAGNANLTRFYQDGCFENNDPRRYEEVKRLNDGLRQRARVALLAYLCGMDRVALPWGFSQFVKEAKDLSALLLLDVESGICERASRVQDGTKAAQVFIERARLGMEGTFPVSEAFVCAWEGFFSKFRTWQACKRQKIYRENYIEWQELEKAGKNEAYRFLESELRRSVLTSPRSGGMEYWPGEHLPAHPSITALQHGEPAALQQLMHPENLGLMGTRERDARPSWLAPSQKVVSGSKDSKVPASTPNNNGVIRSFAAINASSSEPRLPLWIQAAVRLGVRFLRIAAAGEPPATLQFIPQHQVEGLCCCQCGKIHPPVMDEYYFWLVDSRHYLVRTQEAEWGATSDEPTSDWQRPEKLPGLLDWPSKPMVRLGWCRMHNGEFAVPRQSEEGVYLLDGANAQLEFTGRTGDSLQFSVTEAIAVPSGHADPSPWGFRYDMKPDMAVVLPQVSIPAILPEVSGGLKSYPYFVYFEAGAPVEPSLFAPVNAIARVLRTHCKYEAALKWYELYFKPLQNDNRWSRCDDFQQDPGAPANPPVPPRGVVILNRGGANTGGQTNQGTEGGNPDTLLPAGLGSSGNTGRGGTGDGPLPGGLGSQGNTGRGDTGIGLSPGDLGSSGNTGRGGTGDGPLPGGLGSQGNTGRGDTGIGFSPGGLGSSGNTGGGGTSDGPRPGGIGNQGNSRPVRPENPCCQSEVVSEAIDRERSILLHYLKTFGQFADSVIRCNNNSEAVQKARLLFDTMAKLLGARPLTIFSQDDGRISQTVAEFVPLFAPLNPSLMELYDFVDDRLNLIHRCLNGRRLRDGKQRVNDSYWAYSPRPHDWEVMEEPCDADDDCCCPRSPYRFSFVLQKAQETAADVRALGAELLAAYEKGDAEYITALRARHERQLLYLTREIRQNEWREADWQLQALKKTKEGALARRQYYKTLIQNGLIGNEQAYASLTGAAINTRASGNIVEGVGQAMHLIPDPTTGVAGIASTPVAVFDMPVGTKLANASAAAARILYTVADITGTSASLSLTEAGWDRRLQDWVQQVTLIEIEIEQIERQILAADRRRDIALRQLNNLEQQQEQSVEIQNFLRDKFTSHALYLFLQQETAALHFQMYEVALCWALQAQRAFNFESGHTKRRFLPTQAWDTLHEGLLAGEQLQVALRHMEKSYLDQNFREYELTKHISLRLHFPMAFLQLKATGCCEIEFAEWMFDMDYPGHYLRRIKNLSVTIPCVTGPYTGIHCRVTLLGSRTRVDPSLLDARRCCHDDHECCPRCLPTSGYQEIIDDPRFVRQYAALEAVATSSGVNDSGMFELNFRDERYLPFEYAGAVCRLRIELPPGNNQFDLETVSDKVFHLNYMAREGGQVLRDAACKATECCLPGGGLRFFDVQHDFAEAWCRFQSTAAQLDKCGELHLRLNRNMFPFLTSHRGVKVLRFGLYFEAPMAEPSRSHVVEFVPELHLHHKHDEGCGCNVPLITCVASSEWPCFYHGVLEIPIDLIEHNGYCNIGSLKFPHHVGEIKRFYILCTYCATSSERCHLDQCSFC